MKVYLADLVHNATMGGNVLTGNLDFTVPLNVANVGAYLKKVYGDKIDLRLFKYPDKLLAAVDRDPPLILGLSHYAWNSHLNTCVANYVKKYYPNVLIIMGGPMIRITPPDIEQFLRRNPSIDAYVMTEGELPFVDILEHVFAHGPTFRHADQSRLRSVAYLDEAGQFTYASTSTSELGDLADLPSPYLTGLLDEFLDEQLIALFETNRGCPFTCTFCAWGVASMNKVRKFPMERVLEELEYAARLAPKLNVWIFADANFGILPRDIEIARKIREIKERTALKRVITWDSKNTHERNAEIAQILGRYERDQHIANTGMAYLAVQHLNPKVLEHIKRANINLGNLSTIVSRYHEHHVRVTTDVLYGLPTETLEDAIGTVRSAFEIKFDYINIQRTLMLPGSEMETDASREHYGLRSKFMIRRGSYGEYPARHEALRSIECDEIVTSTPVFPEDDVMSYHTLQWLVFYSWNHGKLAPILRYLMDGEKLNPVELLLGIMRCDSKAFPRVSGLLQSLRRDLLAVMYRTPEEMREYYATDDRWQSLLSYVRVELRHNALLYNDPAMYRELVSLIEQILVAAVGGDRVLQDLIAYTRENFVDLRAIADGAPCPEKRLRLVGPAVRYITNANGVNTVNGNGHELILYKSPDDQSATREFLLKYGYHANPVSAIERLLGARYTSVAYDCRVSSSDTSLEPCLAGS